MLVTAGARRRGSWQAGTFGNTPYEDTGALTDVTTEATYLATLATHPGVTLITIATTVGERDVLALHIGTGAGVPVALIAGTHGDEPAPREAAHIFARDLITSTDPAVHQFLSTRSVYVIPTINPDGRVANTRNNGANADINRDFVQLTQPESRGLATLFGQVAPFAYLDAHENGYGTGEFMEYETGLPRMMPFDVYESGLVALQRSVIADLDAAGIANNWDVYPPSTNYVSQTANSTFALAGVHTTLTESENAGGVTLATRVGWQLVAIRAWWDDCVTHAAALTNTTLAGRAERAANIDNGAQWIIGGWYAGLRHPAYSGTTVTATAYTLTGAQYATAQAALAAHNITATTADGGTTYTVSLGQYTAPIAVNMLDPSSSQRLVTATRIP